MCVYARVCVCVCMRAFVRVRACAHSQGVDKEREREYITQQTEESPTRVLTNPYPPPPPPPPLTKKKKTEKKHHQQQPKKKKKKKQTTKRYPSNSIPETAERGWGLVAQSPDMTRVFVTLTHRDTLIYHSLSRLPPPPLPPSPCRVIPLPSPLLPLSALLTST